MFVDVEALNNPRPVFVYGSLLQGLHNHHILAEVAQTITSATVDNVRLYSQGNSFPYAVRKEGERALGEVVTVSDEDWMMTLWRLDSLEGYRGPGGNNHYDRVVEKVTLDNGETVEAYMYLANRSIVPTIQAELPIVPNGDWRTWKMRLDHHLARMKAEANA